MNNEALLKAINSPHKENIKEIILEQNLILENYIESTKNRFSSTIDQMKKQFTI